MALRTEPVHLVRGAHGTVGALGRDASVHASPTDLLSHFTFGIMGPAEARYNRFLLNGDMIGIRLSDSRALPFPVLSATSADARVGQFVWTSKVGYRLIENKKFKADVNVGVRYWLLAPRAATKLQSFDTWAEPHRFAKLGGCRRRWPPTASPRT
jgi:hypothetical protein